ncbi:hypothetical protein EYF80_047126 [Liparis tanakae]|uniref:Uncharacterized protein n=1 Tax=Liparis tanakae TaxID=230148 RepID=A0A4Z2FN74_9TELE|nr:hypothetical protein EYF80_047126 [Liparis tanakae]
MKTLNSQVFLNVSGSPASPSVPHHTQRGSHLARVLDDLHVLLTELVGVELQEPLGDLRQRGELGLLVDVLLSVFILKEALRKKRRRKSTPPPYLSKEGHSEVGAQQSFARVHHLHHFSVGAVEGIIQRAAMTLMWPTVINNTCTERGSKSALSLRLPTNRAIDIDKSSERRERVTRDADERPENTHILNARFTRRRAGGGGRLGTSLKWTSCIPTSSIMAASSSMLGVVTRKAEQPCLNMPSRRRGGFI